MENCKACLAVEAEKRKMKKVIAIVGSAAAQSANLKLVQQIAMLSKDRFDVHIFNDLKTLPPFDPDFSVSHTPAVVEDFREAVRMADGIIICTPEYVFSLPAGLKNAIEWCVATTVFSQKPAGLITASAGGDKGHEALQLIMKTVEAVFSEATTLLISGIKSKFDEAGHLQDIETIHRLQAFVNDFALQLGQT